MKNVEKLKMNSITENRERLDIILIVRNIRKKLATINDRYISKQEKSIVLKAINDYENDLIMDIERRIKNFYEMASEFGNSQIEETRIPRDPNHPLYRLFVNSNTFDQLESDIVELKYNSGVGQEIEIEKVEIPNDFNRPDVSEFANIHENIETSVVRLENTVLKIPSLVMTFTEEERKVFLIAVKKYCTSLKIFQEQRKYAREEIEKEFGKRITDKETYVPMSQGDIFNEMYDNYKQTPEKPSNEDKNFENAVLDTYARKNK